MIKVHYEYGDSNCWNMDINQPGRFSSRKEAIQSAIKHLNNSSHRTRVVLVDTKTGVTRQITDYGYSDSGWRAK